MEIIETQTDASASCSSQSQWLQETISGMDEKLNIILNLLEDNDSLKSDAQAMQKEEIKKIIQEVCISHQVLAKELQCLQSAAKDIKMYVSSPPLKSSSINNNKEELGTLNDFLLENIGSNPESTVEDGDIIECEGTKNDREYVKRFSENSATKDGNNINPTNDWSDGMKCKFSMIVEENTQLQVELIRRNSEKRETIIKLQNQVNRLRIENGNLQRTLSYFNHNKQHIKGDSPRKALLLQRLFSSKSWRCLRYC